MAKGKYAELLEAAKAVLDSNTGCVDFDTIPSDAWPVSKAALQALASAWERCTGQDYGKLTLSRWERERLRQAIRQ